MKLEDNYVYHIKSFEFEKNHHLSSMTDYGISKEEPPPESTDPKTMLGLLRPLATIAKVFGTFQLSGIYQKYDNNHSGRTEVKKNVPVDIIFPLICILFQCFSAGFIYKMLMDDYNVNQNLNFNGIAGTMVDVMAASLGPIFSIYYFFQLSKDLVAFVEAHSCFDSILLKPGEGAIKRLVNFGVVFVLVTGAIKTGCWILNMYLRIDEYHVDLNEWFPPIVTWILAGCFCVGALLLSMAECLVQFTYIFYHDVIRSSFNELLNQIKADAGKKLSVEEWSNKVRTYRMYYQNLCEVTDGLDELFSPILLLAYVFNTVAVIATISFIINQTKQPHITATWEIIIDYALLMAVHWAFLILTSSYANSSKSAASEVLPTLCMNMNLESMEAKAEVDLFAFRAQCKVVVFSASGFFEVDLGILTTLSGAIASYVIIMTQF